jgi:DNA polymerase-3 subunit epsilon
MKRQIVLDTETTGLEPKDGHRVIEIGCVELINRRVTGKTFHRYINPERLIEADAAKVHGITNDFLKDKPVFGYIVDEFIRFIDGAELIIHNAPFDTGFINHEFALLKRGVGRIQDSCTIFDTLPLARKLHPGQRNNLDALCKRYGVDNKHREWHGGLLDAELLAWTYLAMTSGQDSLFGTNEEENASAKEQSLNVVSASAHPRKPLKILRATPEEAVAHQAYLDKIRKA